MEVPLVDEMAEQMAEQILEKINSRGSTPSGRGEGGRIGWSHVPPGAGSRAGSS